MSGFPRDRATVELKNVASVRATSLKIARPVGVNPPPKLVRVESIAVVSDDQFVSTAKVAKDMLSRKHMMWLWALCVCEYTMEVWIIPETIDFLERTQAL